MWQPSGGPRQRVWLRVSLLCVSQGFVLCVWPRVSCDRADTLPETLDHGQLLSKICRNEYDFSVLIPVFFPPFQQKRGAIAALFRISVRISEATLGCQHQSGLRWRLLLCSLQPKGEVAAAAEMRQNLFFSFFFVAKTFMLLSVFNNRVNMCSLLPRGRPTPHSSTTEAAAQSADIKWHITNKTSTLSVSCCL